MQVLKDRVRSRILEAAELQFSRAGFDKATIGDIASEAGVATGTVYKYFRNKAELYRSVITDEFVNELSRMTRSRIAAFARPDGLSVQQPPTSGKSGELLRFFAANRLKVVILLGRAEGTEHAGFAREYVSAMETQALNQARKQFPGRAMTRTFRFMVRKTLAESVRGIVDILAEFDDEPSIREALEAATRYRIAGINSLVAWAMDKGGAA
jgi:AcrR family transcriptional regulator